MRVGGGVGFGRWVEGADQWPRGGSPKREGEPSLRPPAPSVSTQPSYLVSRACRRAHHRPLAGPVRRRRFPLFPITRIDRTTAGGVWPIYGSTPITFPRFPRLTRRDGRFVVAKTPEAPSEVLEGEVAPTRFTGRPQLPTRNPSLEWQGAGTAGVQRDVWARHGPEANGSRSSASWAEGAVWDASAFLGSAACGSRAPSTGAIVG